MAESVRIDRWLWATRSYKTRSQATAACAGGHVKLNGAVVKASRVVQVGDRVEALCPRGLRLLEVRGLEVKRQSTVAAAALYVDHTPAPAPGENARGGRGERVGARPTKRDRRRMDDWRDR